ncbi:TIM barrel protein [Propionispira raffinosivorans]|uniref:TIM barrel protein n=1 Tax=Propionispira raffinosivorans TaxID=86959 RepID=UPI000377F731|nr:TIM barrel protein [Propionispira raffinosivorans]
MELETYKGGSLILELVNLSNYPSDTKDLIMNHAESLEDFLNTYDLDGIEMMLCEPWDAELHRPEWIKGIHLRFWFNWLDFWRQDYASLYKEIGNEDFISKCYGGLTRQDWLNVYRQNIIYSAATPAEYMVFHIAQARSSEVFNYRFSATSREVVMAAVEVVNEITRELPSDRLLLFENLWWPGLTLLDKDLVEYLFRNIEHKNSGIMLDTGHLMNTNLDLNTQAEAVDYVLKTIEDLGEYKTKIHGIHLHYSLSGRYVKQKKQFCTDDPTDPVQLMNHILQIDQHLPFTDSAAKKIVHRICPDYLIHEFVQRSRLDWQQKIRIQKSTMAGV